MCHEISRLLGDIFVNTVRDPPSDEIKEWFRTVSELRCPCTRKMLSTIYLMTHRFFTDGNKNRFDQIWANIILSTARFVFGYDMAEVDPSISSEKKRLILAMLFASFDLARLHISISEPRVFLKPRESLEQLHEILAVLLRVINSINRRCNVYIASVMAGESEDRLTRESLDRFERSLKEEKQRHEQSRREQSLLRLAQLKQRRDRLMMAKGKKPPRSALYRSSSLPEGTRLDSDFSYSFETDDVASVTETGETMSTASVFDLSERAEPDAWLDTLDRSLAELTPCSFDFAFPSGL